jgi:hypothetical protein
MTQSFNQTKRALDRSIEYYARARTRVSTRYIDEFFRLKCAPDLLASGLLPRTDPTKEVTEIMGMFSAVRRHLSALFKDPTVVVLDVGAGVSPRGAAMFALRTKWNALAIDPDMRRDTVIRRVSAFKATVEDVIPTPRVQSLLKAATTTVCINTHGHAPLSYLDAIPGDAWCVTLPCCVKLTPPKDFELVERYNDPSIMSEKNEVSVYHRAG